MKKTTVRSISVVLAAALVLALIYYVTLPPLNIHSAEFWTFFLFADALVFVSYLAIGVTSGKIFAEEVRFPSGAIDWKASLGKKLRFPKYQLILTALVIVFLLVGSVVGSTFFRAKTYSSLIDVEECEFSEEIESTEQVRDIALMDTASARIIGARTLGTLSDLVSQYNVSNSYTQIALSSGENSWSPYKVAPLEYASFFKWLTNGKNGIPGYVKVDAVRFNAEFVRLDGDYIKYSPSSYFSKDLMRALRFKFPTEIFYSVHFEVDDSGHPYWIAPTMKPRAGLFGALDVSGVVILDACTGEAYKTSVEESPEWIDIVYYGDLVCKKYDWYGMLREGYLNSAFAQTNCVVTTDDFGYKIIGNDTYIFTGVTSTSNDEANIGFILANSRTGKYKYFAVPGAEEYSAMASAQGAVQQYKYRASFPSLINVSDEPTYIMVLKDDSGIVKMYAMVNVKNYNIVVTGTTQDEVFARYKAALAQNGIETDSTAGLLTEDVTVDEIIYIVSGGETVAYIKSTEGVYRAPFEESLILAEKGDKVTVYYGEKTDGITDCIKAEKK